MAEEDDKTKTAEPTADLAAMGAAGASLAGPLATTDGDAPPADEEEDHAGHLGSTRFVYAAYLGGAMLVAFVVEKSAWFGWMRLAQWKPQFGEPRDEIIMPAAAIIGGVVAIYYWRRTRARELAEDVASELSKVTWPSRKEVMNNTVIVIVTTLFATVFFTLMDRFWGFVTNMIYGT